MSRRDEAVLIALGSNIDPERWIVEASLLLAQQLDVNAWSSVYESPAIDAPGTPTFLNAVLRIEPGIGARSLKFGVLQAIERRLGRRRSRDRNAPRTIDLDLVMHGSQTETAVDLVLPDPELANQAHIAVPAAEVAGEARHPILGRSLSQIASVLPGKLTRRTDLELGRIRPVQRR